MIKIIPALIALIFSPLLPACGGHKPACIPDMKNMPALLALKFHADWCEPCIHIAHILSQIENKYDESPILFVELDMTEETDWKKAEYLAATLGVKSIFDAQNGELGMVLLVDTKSKEILGSLDVTLTPKKMQSKIDAALKQALATQ